MPGITFQKINTIIGIMFWIILYVVWNFRLVFLADHFIDRLWI